MRLVTIQRYLWVTARVQHYIGFSFSININIVFLTEVSDDPAGTLQLIPTKGTTKQKRAVTAKIIVPIWDKK